jgi:polyhydroxybutyrate depolymerase
MQVTNGSFAFAWFAVVIGAASLGCSSDTGIKSAAGASGAGGDGGASGGPGSGGSGGSGGTSDAGACKGDWTPGDYPPGIDDTTTWLTMTGVPGQNDLARQYKVHVPPKYDCHVPTPILFCMHGLQQNGVMFCVNGTAGASSGAKGFVDKSNEAGFILVIPTGYNNSWNGAGCCGNANSQNLDDAALLKAILAEVSTHLNVDARRVFATGLSNGGYMSYRLACEAADVFTAIAPGSGGLRGIPCNPARPISVLDIHGTNDNLVPYSLQATSMSALAVANGCAATTRPATIPASGGDTTCVTYEGCPAGIEVTGCTVQGGGHVWFGDPSCGTGASSIGCGFVGANSTFLNNTDAVWSFLSRLSR